MSYEQILAPGFQTLPVEERRRILARTFTRTRVKILNAAMDLSRKRPFGEVSFRDIAAETGLSPGNLTYHFKSRIVLAEALCAYLASMSSFSWPASPARSFQELNETIIAAIRHYRIIHTLNLNSIEAVSHSELYAQYEQNEMIAGEGFFSSTLDVFMLDGWLSSSLTPQRLSVLSHTLMISIYFTNHYWKLRRTRTAVLRQPGIALWYLLLPSCSEAGARNCEEYATKWDSGFFDEALLVPEPDLLKPDARARRGALTEAIAEDHA